MSLYDKLKFAVAANHHDANTLESYWMACKKMFRFCGKPASQWTGPDVQRFMVHLHDLNYSRSARKNALCAMAYVFKHILHADMGQLNLPPMPPERKPLKIIPTREEIAEIFKRMKGHPKLITALLYGSGTRIGESCELRVQDIDLSALTVRIHGGKGDKDRLTVLPALLVPALQRQIAWRRSLHEIDLANGGGRVELPGRLAFKYRHADRELRWQYLFPSAVTRGEYRWHITPKAVGDQVRAAIHAAGIIKRITPHTLRHAFATHSLRMGNDIETIRELLGHDSIETTAIYLHADAARGMSPLDVPLRNNTMTIPTIEAPRAHLLK